MYGIRTAESHYLWGNADLVLEKGASPTLEQQNHIICGENAEAVPEMAASPALEQQNLIIWGKLLKQCRR